MADYTLDIQEGSAVSLSSSAVSAGAGNCYATLTELKAMLGITSTSKDGVLLRLLEAASREAEGPSCARRVFYSEYGVRYFDPPATHMGYLLLPDLLSISELVTDEDGDLDYTGDAWVEGTDFVLGPANIWPKTELRLTANTDEAWPSYERGLKITGVWGAGNLGSADPWRAAGVNGTLSGADDTSLALSAEGAVEAGHTIRMGSEQIYVASVTSDWSGQATVVRGVNGTTAASHDSVAIELAEYPADVVQGTLVLACEAWNLTAKAGVVSEGIGNFRQSLRGVSGEVKGRIFARTRR